LEASLLFELDGSACFSSCSLAFPNVGGPFGVVSFSLSLSLILPVRVDDRNAESLDPLLEWFLLNWHLFLPTHWPMKPCDIELLHLRGIIIVRGILAEETLRDVITSSKRGLNR